MTVLMTGGANVGTYRHEAEVCLLDITWYNRIKWKTPRGVEERYVALLWPSFSLVHDLDDTARRSTESTTQKQSREL